MTHLITIPETTLPGGLIVPTFQVGQYPCSQDSDGKLAIAAEGTPWVDINFTEAKAACESAGLKLITESQWLAIAWLISQQDSNWTGGKVGEGSLYQGLRKGTVGCAVSGSYEPFAPDERTWHQLPNGDRIYHFAGNVFSWVFDDIHGDSDGLTTTIKADSPSLTTAPYPSLEKGMGWRPDDARDWSGYALIRGGCWCSGSNAGAFYLNLGWPDGRSGGVGFRCTNPGL